MPATSAMAITEPITERIITPTATANRTAMAALMTMYSPERSGMSARSRRRSSAPDVSMRPKIPAIRTVTAESSPCSGDSDTTSTGTLAVPMVSSRMSARVRCFVRTRMMAATTARARPPPTRTAATKASAWELCGRLARTAALTSRPRGGAPASRRARPRAAPRRGRAAPAGGGARSRVARRPAGGPRRCGRGEEAPRPR